MNKNTLPVVLLLSKDKRTIALFKRLLQEHFYFLEAATLEDTIDRVQTTEIDLLILDEKTTGASFIDLCRQVRSKTEPWSLSILLITNNLKKSFIKRALNAGVSDFINEPFEKEELFQRLAVVDKAKEMQRKLSSVRNYLSTQFKEKRTKPPYA